MKITFKEFSRAYAEEYYYVLLNQRKLIKNPNKPIKFATKSFVGYVIYASIFAAISLFISAYSKDLLPFLFVPVLTFVITLHTYYRINKNVSKLNKSDATAFLFTMTEKHIIFGQGKDNGVLMNWEEVQKVIFTQNSVIFLPNAIDIFPIVVPISAKKDVKTMAKKKQVL